jgi:hypothetical protein
MGRTVADVIFLQAARLFPNGFSEMLLSMESQIFHIVLKQRGLWENDVTARGRSATGAAQGRRAPKAAGWNSGTGAAKQGRRGGGGGGFR